MGRQSSRIWYQNKDHKEMVTYNGGKPQYHDSAYIWKNNRFQLVWKKIYDSIADPIVGVQFNRWFVPYKIGDYYIGSKYPDTYCKIVKIEKNTHEETLLLENSPGVNDIEFGGICQDGRLAAVRHYVNQGNDDRMIIIDIDSEDILLAEEITVTGDSDKYASCVDEQAKQTHKYMFAQGTEFRAYRYESSVVRSNRNYTNITSAFLGARSAGGFASSCNRVQTLCMGSTFFTQYGVRFADTSPYTASFVEIVSWGDIEPYTSGLVYEESFPFETNGGTEFYMDNGHLIVVDRVWNTTKYYVVEIPSLKYFVVDVSEIPGADNNATYITVSPSGNTIIYTKPPHEHGENSKYYKKNKGDAHWSELICSDANYDFNYDSGERCVDLVDDSIFFMKRYVGQGVFPVYQAYKLRQAQ